MNMITVEMKNMMILDQMAKDLELMRAAMFELKNELEEIKLALQETKDCGEN